MYLLPRIFLMFEKTYLDHLSDIVIRRGPLLGINRNMYSLRLSGIQSDKDVLRARQIQGSKCNRYGPPIRYWLEVAAQDTTG